MELHQGFNVFSVSWLYFYRTRQSNSQEWAQEQVDKKAEGWLAAKTNFKIAYFNFRQETDLDEYDFTNRQDYSIGVHSLLQYLGENEWEMVNAVNKFKDAMKSESPDVDVYYFCKTKSA